MKRFITIICYTIFIPVALLAQETKVTTNSIITDSEEYQKLKASGKLGNLIESGKVEVNPFVQIQSSQRKKEYENDLPDAQINSSSCYGYTPPTPSANPTLVNVDDQAFGPIALPFNFCFYGTNYSSCYLNSNGNVTFGAAYTTYTASGFPSATIPAMLAPFWGDVDTRPNFGTCYYDIYSNAAIFHWVGVGYYNQHGDKLNTFQLIITDFTSPLLQPGKNVGFFYDDMNWTTGDASNGTNGFGGTPATVGVNEGNGTDYIQIGRFDGPGGFYDGAFNLNDSVDWLDNKSFMFDVCNSTNIAPIVAGIDFCDTVYLCVGDSFPVNVSFLAPEANQTVWAGVDTSQASGLQIVSNSSGTGSSAQIISTFIADTSNVGVNILTFTSYDNGVPPDTITFDFVILVDSMPLLPVITGDTAYCQGSNVVLDAGSGFDSYLWSNSDTTQTSTVTQGSYTVQAFLGGCSYTTPPFVVTQYPTPIPSISGDTLYCPGDSVLLSATFGFDSYLWNTSANDTLDSIYVTQGNYTVTVVDSNGCQGTSATFTVNSLSNTINIYGDTTFCTGDSVLLYVDDIFDSYLWSNGGTTDSTYVTQGNHWVQISLSGCTATDTHNVNEVIIPIPIITGNSSYCAGGSVLLDADSVGNGYTGYLWSPTGQNTQTINATQGTYTVTTTLNGCQATSAPFTVTSNPLPNPVITGNLIYCANDSNGTTLSTVNSYAQYNWSNGDTTATIIADANPPSNYTVTVTDANGCQGTSAVVSITSSTPNNTISGLTGFCNGQNITINADPGFTSYLWNTGDTTQAVTVSNGTYTVTVSDQYGCQDVDTITLTGWPIPNANFTISPPNHGQPGETIIFTDASTIGSGSISSWSWDFDVTGMTGANPSIEITQGPHQVVFTEQGTYSISLQVVSNNGCVGSVTIDYLIIDDLVIPNVITPNGDDNNDYLVFKNLEYHSGNHLIILNRWGKKIYEKDDYANDWYGKDYSEGTYFFILTVDDMDEVIKGTFTLMK